MEKKFKGKPSFDLQSSLEKTAKQFKDSDFFNMQYARYAHILACVECYGPGLRVLDVGSAPGHMAFTLSGAGYSVTGIVFDLNEDYEATQQQFARQARESSVSLVKADIACEPFPLPDRSFDVVILSEVLEHIWSFPLKALKEIFRVLVPGGILVLTTPNVWHLSNIARLLSGKTQFVALEEMISLPVHMRHNREYTKGEVGHIVARAGFEIIKSEYRNWHLWITRDPKSGKFESKFRLISWRQVGKLLTNPIKMAVPFFRDSILIVARKRP